MTSYSECIWGSLREPKTIQNLRRSLSNQDLLIATCDGAYRLFYRIDDRGEASLPKVIASKRRLPGF